MTPVMLIVGLAMLVAGGHALVQGADGLARAIGMSPLVVGLTVVSFATSAPELAVTVDASLSGSPGLAVGNVVGSNMANILLVLGVAGLILPLAVRTPVIRRDIPVMIGLSVLLLVMSIGGRVSQLEGGLLLALLVAYVAWTIVRSREVAGAGEAGEPGTGENPESDAGTHDPATVTADGPVADGRDDAEAARPRTTNVPVGILYVAGGVALLVIGARWLVSAASDVAVDLGVSDLVVGLTVVALGTSLPELATSVIAAIRGEIEMAVGNVVGSNIFNIGSVMAVTALVTPGGVPVEASAVRFDLPLMLAVALALLPIAFTGFVVARWEAALFTLYYVAYGAYLLLDSTAHDALPGFSVAMLGFVMPITALTLIVFATFEAGVRKGRREEAAARAR
jgi:cation:H+ antiporter